MCTDALWVEIVHELETQVDRLTVKPFLRARPGAGACTEVATEPRMGSSRERVSILVSGVRLGKHDERWQQRLIPTTGALRNLTYSVARKDVTKRKLSRDLALEVGSTGASVVEKDFLSLERFAFFLESSNARLKNAHFTFERSESTLRANGYAVSGATC